MNSPNECRFWLNIKGEPRGPFLVLQIHEMLARGEIDWDSPSCPLGENRWTPLLTQRGIGPTFAPIPCPPLEPPSVSHISSVRLPYRYPVLLRVLRTFLIGNVILHIATLGLSFLGGVLEAEEDRDASLQAGGSEVFLSLLILWIPAIVAAYVGLWKCRNWGRRLFLGLTVLDHVVDIGLSLTAFEYEWQLPDAINSISSTIAGLILGLVFLSPLAATFRSQNRVLSD